MHINIYFEKTAFPVWIAIICIVTMYDLISEKNVFFRIVRNEKNVLINKILRVYSHTK